MDASANRELEFLSCPMGSRSTGDPSTPGSIMRRHNLWKLEQPAHAVANGYFIAAINRVGYEEPWLIGEFYGQSYFCVPQGVALTAPV